MRDRGKEKTAPSYPKWTLLLFQGSWFFERDTVAFGAQATERTRGFSQ